MERHIDNDYKKNRERVAELYGLDSKDCSFHHICPKAEVNEGRFGDIVTPETVHEKANLYPFECDGDNHQSSEHARLHALIARREARPRWRVLYRRKRR
jgi:hypothetical protein